MLALILTTITAIARLYLSTFPLLLLLIVVTTLWIRDIGILLVLASSPAAKHEANLLDQILEIAITIHSE